jgi:hypothetical protein
MHRLLNLRALLFHALILMALGCGKADKEEPVHSVAAAGENIQRILLENMVQQNNDLVPEKRASMRLSEEDAKTLWSKNRNSREGSHFRKDFAGLLDDSENQDLTDCLAAVTSVDELRACKWPTPQDTGRAREYIKMELNRLNGLVQEEISRRLQSDIVIKTGMSPDRAFKEKPRKASEPPSMKLPTRLILP